MKFNKEMEITESLNSCHVCKSQKLEKRVDFSAGTDHKDNFTLYWTPENSGGSPWGTAAGLGLCSRRIPTQEWWDGEWDPEWPWQTEEFL